MALRLKGRRSARPQRKGIEFRSRPQVDAAVGRRNRVPASEAGKRDLASSATRCVMLSRLVINTVVRAFLIPLR